MNCKEIHTVTKYGGELSPAFSAEAEGHIKNCAACKSLLLSERLAPAIIKAAANTLGHDGSRIHSNAVLVGRIKRRIQEIREQRSSSWEAAVEAMGGWLAAFAVAAIILVTVSIQSRPSVIASDLDLVTQNADEHIISDAPVPTGVSKDNPYVAK